MKIQNLTKQDLPELAALQPPDWQDIIPSFSFYLDSPFCMPVKAVVDNCPAGVGSAISFGDTAWIAHIIVHPNYRNRGIGLAIVKHLISYLEKSNCSTILLIATYLGEPVYLKAGFKPDTDYIFFHEGAATNIQRLPENVISYKEKYMEDILSLDRKVSGEDRRPLLYHALEGSYLYVTNNILRGFYLPTLGDGLIIADDKEAGLELMQFKYAGISKAVLPSDNDAGVDFLLRNNFKEKLRVRRMWLGKKLEWQPEKLYSRIGGHVG